MSHEMLNLTAAIFQSTDISVVTGSRLFMIFVGVVSISVLFQTVALIAMAIGAAKTQKQFLRIAEEMRAKSLPVLEISRSILEETAPKLRVITDNVAEASFLIRDQAQRLDHVVKNTVEMANEQIERADQMVSATLDGIGEITSTVQRTVMVPVKQIAGLMNGLKAAVEKLTGTKLPRSVYGRNEDDFV
jgi:methyl-accepting chemotaxis protein